MADGYAGNLLSPLIWRIIKDHYCLCRSNSWVSHGHRSLNPETALCFLLQSVLLKRWPRPVHWISLPRGRSACWMDLGGVVLVVHIAYSGTFLQHWLISFSRIGSLGLYCILVTCDCSASSLERSSDDPSSGTNASRRLSKAVNGINMFSFYGPSYSCLLPWPMTLLDPAVSMIGRWSWFAAGALVGVLDFSREHTRESISSWVRWSWVWVRTFVI
jgi:hypothetical protein